MKLFGTTSALALLMLAAPVCAMPAGMGPVCQSNYETYAASNAPKAFAKGKTKGCGYAYGKANIAEARRVALSFCKAHGGDGCRVVESR